MKQKSGKEEVSPSHFEKLLQSLKIRFENNMKRHPNLDWNQIHQRLEQNKKKLWSLNEMESTGGEPDLVVLGNEAGEYVFVDCSKESPKGRTSLCYDREGFESRKEHKPKNNAVDMAASMGVELLNEEQYRNLQKFGEFDTKTSSWIKTPTDIRELGGALFCDRRFGHVFVYHNGAQSYYSARGFRAMLRI